MKRNIKNYCTQNKGGCKNCSLVNYGRDCKNQPVNGRRLDQDNFLFCMKGAVSFQRLSKGLECDFWMGYIRGLRRNYHGSDFGDEHEHKMRMNAIDSVDENRKIMSRGYRAGYAGKELSKAIEMLFENKKEKD